MKNREERSQHFFATSVPLMDDGEDNTLYDRVRVRATDPPAARVHSAVSFSLWTFSFPETQLDWHCVACTSIQCFQLVGEQSWGPYCFFLSKDCMETLSGAFQNLLESSLHTPLPGRTLRHAGFSLVLLPLGSGAAADKGFSVSPALAGGALEPADSGRSFLLGKNKCLCVVCSIEIVSNFIFFKLYLKWYTITFLGRDLMCTFRPFCLARALQMSS